MATHALFAAPGFEGPKDDVALVVCAGERFSVGGASDGCDVTGVAGEEAETVAAGDVPHADGAVAGAGEDVEVVGVEGYAVDVVVVANI